MTDVFVFEQELTVSRPGMGHEAPAHSEDEGRSHSEGPDSSGGAQRGRVLKLFLSEQHTVPGDRVGKHKADRGAA